MKLTAVIPTLGERPELAPLTRQLIGEGVDVLVFGCPDENIHRIWNQGAQQARDWRQADAVAILNDDIRLPPRTLHTMYQVMIANGFDCIGIDQKAPFGLADSTPDIQEITGSVERLMLGVTTWCFLININAWQDIDEQYEWWWGVGDLFVKIQQSGGRLGYVKGLGIEHIGSGTARNHPWTEEAKMRDAKRWREAH